MILAVPFGVAVGLSIGTLGAGGSLLAIPVLVHVAGLDVHAATTASLLVVGVGAVAGVVPHSLAGAVRLRTGVAFALVGSAGAVVGSLLNRQASDTTLALGFALLAVTMAALLGRRTALGRIGDPGGDTGADAAGEAHPPWARVAVAASAVGFLTGFFGVGGGFMIVPALVLALGLSMREAVGTSLVVIALNAGVAVVARLPSLGVDWTVVGPFAGAGIVGVAIGSVVARRSAPDRLAYALAGLLVVVAGVMGLPAATELAGR